jgi:hypothetical protein
VTTRRAVRFTRPQLEYLLDRIEADLEIGGLDHEDRQIAKSARRRIEEVLDEWEEDDE